MPQSSRTIVTWPACCCQRAASGDPAAWKAMAADADARRRIRRFTESFMSDLLHLMPGCRPPVADIGQSGGLRPIGAAGYSANSLKIKGLALWPGDCTSEGRGNENEKRIADSGRFTDDAGAGRRAGCRPRVRGG